MKRNLRTLVYVIALVLFTSNYQICEYFYPLTDDESIKMWWFTKSNIYGVIVALVLLASSIGERGVLRFVLDVGIGLSMSNVVDRLYFNTNQFNKYDIVMIAITIIVSIIDYKKEKDVRNINQQAITRAN